MGDRLATIDMGQKVGGAVPLFRGAEYPSNTMLPGTRPTSVGLPSGILIHPAVWPQQTWAEKWGLCPFWGAGSPSNTVSWAEATSLPSGILIHPAVWPQYMGQKVGAAVPPFLGEGWVPV